jgi:cytochrome c
VYGRRAGSVPGFSYSSGIKNSGVTWSEETLERWLRDTDAMAPGNAMGISVPKAQERSDLIAFLKSVQ